MAELDDVTVGRQLLEHGRITREDLLSCLFEIALERRAGQIASPLGVVVVKRGLVRRLEIGMILSERVHAPEGSRTPSQTSDLAFGELLVAAGAATTGQVNECLKAQRDSKLPGRPSRRLGELLVERGYSTSVQIRRTLAYQGKKIYFCRKCGTQFNVLGAQAGRNYRCTGCGGDLTFADHGPVAVCESSIGLATTAALREPVREPVPVAATALPVLPPDAQVHIDRAVKLYLRQKAHVKRSILNDAERFQFELARYGLWVSFLEVVRRFGGITWQQSEEMRRTNFDALVKSDTWKSQTVPGYRIRAKIAAGGFGTIFAAEPIFGGRPVALKVMHADRAADPQHTAFFKREAGLMMKFQHPHIVRGFDYVEDGGLRYIVMELVEGDSLDRRVLESGGGLPVRQALALGRQIADALRFMHQEGFVHRDVKPANVIVTPDGAAKLCDLGLSVEMRPEAIGVASETAGTLAFMSPEQLRGEKDLRAGADVYSLGASLYFMISGRRPFTEHTSDDMPAVRMTNPNAMPDLAHVAMPGPVFRLLEHMLQPQRAKRCADMQHAIAGIDQALVEMG